MLLAVAPNVFNRIKLRCVGRQEFQFDSAPLVGDKFTHQPAAMNRKTIPDDRQFATNVALKVFQELNDLWRLDTAGKKPEVEVPDRNARHGRKAFPVEGVLEHWGLAARCPGADPVRSFAQTAFVHKHYGSALLERFFFISGQRTRFQRWMAASSRWVARPTGRWQLQPKERRIRHTCPG